ncbi:alpha/beta hydrolase [Herbiconiux liukaitaii]|uniref:alpha/beta hydrolase n=1 Tax=Herbiconiux liukaitaii TaxID=3342799 RepID=UPI0035BA29B1
MTSDEATPFVIDDQAVVWSVPADSIASRLAVQPLVIVMHGRGSHENDLPSLFPLLPDGIVYASLRAPLSGEPYGMGGWSWFTPGAPALPPVDSVQGSVAAVLAWLDRVEAAFGAPPAVAALGFSQGGAMSVQLLRASPERFAAAVNLSGFVATETEPGDAVLARTLPPLFWGRDIDDPIIPQSGIDRTAAFVPGHFTVTAREYPGIAHSISRDEADDVARFLRDTLLQQG